MSSLWQQKETVQLQKKQLQTIDNKRPSPKHRKWSLAQDLNFLLKVQSSSTQSPLRNVFQSTIERISLFTFFSGKLPASMTVEAALVLPMFLFFFLNLSCAIEMIRLHGNLELAMWETGGRMSVYGHILSDGTETDRADMGGILGELLDVAFSYTYVKGSIVEYAGEAYLNRSPLLYGTDSLQFVESEIFTSGDTFEIIMTYTVSPWMQMTGVRQFRMVNRYFGHIWNGYDISGATSAGGTIPEIVYVSENGEVYHIDKNCTHLSLAIRKIPIWQVENERNENGKRYTLCRKCGYGIKPDTVFISVEGDRYHYDRGCAGINRTVYKIAGEDIEKYRLCSRCASALISVN